MTVNHGGTGTLMAACKSLKPMVIVPFFLDQPLHAERMHSLIGCPVISAVEYSRHSAVQALRQAMEKREPMSASLGELMAGEKDGALRGAQQILAVLEVPKEDLSVGAAG
jgi:UDP:flavonoid glycosyltransferase YjiC (YdhE family)